MTGIRIRVARTAGSVPREAGAEMLVTAEGTEGTIGGGALEWQAMAEARAMLADGRTRMERTWPLGPALGQCCGGSVTLSFERAESLERATGAPLWVWGAGHVGRAIVATMAPLPAFDITWIDAATDRFPQETHGVTVVPAADMPRLAARAPREAHHLILTYSHEIDLALCHALLTRGFAGAGLIGSATKWARFRSRLAALGHERAQILRIACPIGDPALGKHPQAIAVGVAAALLTATRDQVGDRTG
ncbi:xanthine dehydrogenase accessory protein XdhC [Histidinibacterium lentulum]|uniref:Xanthine dehydrogenase accessory protein XdhC n=1 Tax=Histidinibacterium lentulum TaxID=2480588 RepID=A0A3N2R529_9RHOB|nr:xanthine dehydrogenase accessory protein XdhC [Histidinibacterium lentulum]ROU02471.1 xanthine dehydrogenase accessory protein XdhC [Histidinibacterium lentulum]